MLVMLAKTFGPNTITKQQYETLIKDLQDATGWHDET